MVRISPVTGRCLLNDGTSKVTAGQNWVPAQSASCALLIDIDNDQDLDLVVVDEEEDQVVVLRQSPEIWSSPSIRPTPPRFSCW